MSKEIAKYKKIPLNQPFGVEEDNFSHWNAEKGITSLKELLKELRPPILPLYERVPILGLDEWRRKQKLQKIRKRLVELKIK